jgi:hypothetical protein
MSSRFNKKNPWPAVSMASQKKAIRSVQQTPKSEACIAAWLDALENESLEGWHPREVLPHLINTKDYPLGLVWVGEAHSKGSGYPLGELPIDLNCRYVCPNPLGAHERKKVNVIGLQNNLVEFDGYPIREQLMYHLYLAQYAVLKALVFSGNESVHGWYAAHDHAVTNDRFKKLAAVMGADRAMFNGNGCQATRMPNAIRENGAKQTLIYLKDVGMSKSKEEQSQ